MKQVEREVLIPAQAELLGEQAETETSKRSLMASQEDLARTQEQAIPQTLRMEHHKNFIDMVDDGEYGKAALSQLPLLVNGLENFLLFRFLGKGAAAPTLQDVKNTMENYTSTTETWKKNGHTFTRTTSSTKGNSASTKQKK